MKRKRIDGKSGAKGGSSRSWGLYGDSGSSSLKDDSIDLPICQGNHKLFGCHGLQGKNLGSPREVGGGRGSRLFGGG